MEREGRYLGRVSANIVWHFGEIGLRTGGVFLLFVLAARSLGPQDYGFLMTVVAVARLVKAPAGLGLNSIAVREIVVQRDSERSITENIFILRSLAGVIGAAAVVAFMYSYRELDAAGSMVALLVATTVVFQARQAFEAHAQARERFAFLFWVQVASVAAVFGILAVVLTGDAPSASTFAGFYGLMWGIPLVVFLGWWAREGGGSRTAIWDDWDLRRRLLSKSWPLILSSAAAMLYVKSDLILVNFFLGDEPSGYYASVIQLVSAVALLAMVVARVCFPELIRRRNEGGFDSAVSFFRRVGWPLLLLGIGGAAIAHGFSGGILRFVFGDPYTAGTAALQVYALAIPVLFFGEWVSKMLVAEELYTLSLTRHIYAGVLNVALNIWLIPIYGAVAAAVATVVAYVIAVIVVPCVHERARLYLRYMIPLGKRAG